MDEKIKVILITPGVMSKAESIALCLSAQIECDLKGIPVIVCTPDEVIKPKNRLDNAFDNFMSKMAMGLIPIAVEAQKDANNYDPAPTKLQKRKKNNELKNYAQQKFKTKLKSLRR